MKFRWMAWAGVLALFPAETAPARDSLADLEPFRDGCRALADQRFTTATDEFTETWNLLETEEAGDVEKNFVASRLLEAWVRGGESASAVEWCRGQALFQPTSQTLRWMAVAFETEELFAEAAEYYAQLQSTSERPARHVILNRAVCLARSGEEETAFELLEERLTPTTPEEAVIFARIATAAGRNAHAIQFLDEVPEGEISPDLSARAARLRIWALNGLGRKAEALSQACDLIDAASTPIEARKSFLFLETIASGRPLSDELERRFQEWIETPSHPASEAAGLFAVLLNPAAENRTARLDEFLSRSSDPALRAEAMLRQGSSSIREAIGDADSNLAEDLRDRIEFAIASDRYRMGKFEEAADRFLQAARLQGGEARSLSRYNAAIAALQKDDVPTFTDIREELGRSDPRSPAAADLDYLGGLYYAATGDPKAFDLLNSFVREHPDHPSQANAQLALAEIQLNQAPARPQAAREILELLRSRPLTLSQSERLDYIAVWAEIADSNALEAVRLGDRFIADWPSSSYLAEVAFLVAGEHFGQQNPEAARDRFDFAAENAGNASLAETARFFAAKSSPPHGETVARWTRLIDSEGDLEREARHELGLLLLSLDRFDEARAHLARLIDDPECPLPLRHAALADRAFSWYAEALANDKDADMLSKSASQFADLSRLPETTRLWRYNAAVRRGKCLEALGNAPVALEIYRSIVGESDPSSSVLGEELSPREAAWVFRAGFSAVDIMAAEGDWKGAIRMADALSEKDGPRAIEARLLAERMRLKHWVWD